MAEQDQTIFLDVGTEPDQTTFNYNTQRPKKTGLQKIQLNISKTNLIYILSSDFYHWQYIQNRY